MQIIRHLIFGLALALSLGISTPVLSQSEQAEIDRVQELIESSQYGEAMDTADRFIERHPEDPRMRFLKGLILTNQAKWQEAIEVFRALSRDFPNLPAPLNNLAVVYAEIGEYDLAKDVLKDAIKIAPDYAAAHENLGDIYVTLAVLAYREAGSQKGKKQTAQAKLKILRQLVPDLPAAPRREPSSVASTATSTGSTTLPDTPRREPSSVVSTATSTASSTQQFPVTEVESLVQAWAAAWSGQDAEKYLSFYSDTFTPADGKSLQEWRAERKLRLEFPDYIKVQIRELRTSQLSEGQASAIFVQVYDSNTYQSTAWKELILERQQNHWRIVRETVHQEQ